MNSAACGGVPLVLLVRRRHRMVLMPDAPRAVDLAKADGQPKLESARRRRTTGSRRPATHDGNSKGDGVAGIYLQLFDVESVPGPMIGEEQVPGLAVFC